MVGWTACAEGLPAPSVQAAIPGGILTVYRSVRIVPNASSTNQNFPARQTGSALRSGTGSGCPLRRNPAGFTVSPPVCRRALVEISTRAPQTARPSTLAVPDSSAHSALLTPQFSAAFPRLLNTHALTHAPSSIENCLLVEECGLFRYKRATTSHSTRSASMKIAQAGIIPIHSTEEQPAPCSTATWEPREFAFRPFAWAP